MQSRGEGGRRQERVLAPEHRDGERRGDERKVPFGLRRRRRSWRRSADGAAIPDGGIFIKDAGSPPGVIEAGEIHESVLAVRKSHDFERTQLYRGGEWILGFPPSVKQYHHFTTATGWICFYDRASAIHYRSPMPEWTQFQDFPSEPAESRSKGEGILPCMSPGCTARTPPTR